MSIHRKLAFVVLLAIATHTSAATDPPDIPTVIRPDYAATQLLQIGMLPVEVDRDSLGRPVVEINLGDQQYSARLLDSDLSGDLTTYRYEMSPGLVSTFTVFRGEIAATIYSPNGAYTLLPGVSGYLLALPGWCAGRPCAASCGSTDFSREASPDAWNVGTAANLSKRRRAVGPPNTKPQPVQIDIAKLYTEQARVQAGGTDQIDLAIHHSVDLMNTILQTTGVGHIRFRLVYAGLAEYQDDRPGKDVLDALHWLVGLVQPPAAQFARMRDQYGADLVELWVANTGDMGGVAQSVFYLKDFKPENGACTVAVNAAMFARAAQHEEGHLLRLEHDLADAYPWLQYNPYPYAHGYIHDLPPLFRDVMTYSKPCPTCPEFPWFSNPQIQYLGTPTGDPATADAARILRWAAPLVSNYSPTKVP